MYYFLVRNSKFVSICSAWNALPFEQWNQAHIGLRSTDLSVERQLICGRLSTDARPMTGRCRSTVALGPITESDAWAARHYNGWESRGSIGEPQMAPQPNLKWRYWWSIVTTALTSACACQTRTSHMERFGCAPPLPHKHQHTHPFFFTSLIQYLSFGSLSLNLMQLFFWISSTAATKFFCASSANVCDTT